MAFPDNSTLLDNFTGTTGTHDANWSKVPTLSSFLDYSSGHGASSNPGSTSVLAYWNATTFGPDSDFFVTYQTVASPAEIFRVGARVGGVGTANHFGYYVHITSANVWTLIRIDPGSSATLATGPTLALSAGDRVGIRIAGSTITGYYSASGGGAWTSELSYDTAGDGTRYTSAGYAAVLLKTAKIDDFSGGTITVGQNVFIGAASETGAAVARAAHKPKTLNVATTLSSAMSLLSPHFKTLTVATETGAAVALTLGKRVALATNPAAVELGFAADLSGLISLTVTPPDPEAPPVAPVVGGPVFRLKLLPANSAQIYPATDLYPGELVFPVETALLVLLPALSRTLILDPASLEYAIRRVLGVAGEIGEAQTVGYTEQHSAGALVPTSTVDAAVAMTLKITHHVTLAAATETSAAGFAVFGWDQADVDNIYYHAPGVDIGAVER